MKNSNYMLFIEINSFEYIFFVGKKDENNNFEILFNIDIPITGFENNRISDLEKIFNVIKENIFVIEQKFSCTFREVVLILDNLNPKFINVSGFKKLNSSQILRENITYILNTLKSYVDQTEEKKTILHIFNSSFSLDNKKIQNLPIGLFGDFYSHELSLALINTNDYKNLNNIFDKCNLKINKIFLKSFVQGSLLSDNNLNNETFSHITINDDNSKIFYFEKDSLKFQQNFNFGSNIIIKDISKITSLSADTTMNILKETELSEKIIDSDYLDKKFFTNDNFRKIKKKLIYEIVLARAQELSDLMILKNVNFTYHNKLSKIIFLEFSSKLQSTSLVEILQKTLSMNKTYDVRPSLCSKEQMLNNVNKLVHYGWKKEAIPISQPRKSMISRFFDTIFG